MQYTDCAMSWNTEGPEVHVLDIETHLLFYGFANDSTEPYL